MKILNYWLLPISDISITTDGSEKIVSGSFAKILNGADEEIEGIEDIYSGSLSIKLPGRIEEPKIEDINDNTVIFQHSGLLKQTFFMSSNTQELRRRIHYWSSVFDTTTWLYNC